MFNTSAVVVLVNPNRAQSAKLAKKQQQQQQNFE